MFSRNHILSTLSGIFLAIFVLKMLDILVAREAFTFIFLAEGDFWIKFFLAIPITLIINYFYLKNKNKK